MITAHGPHTVFCNFRNIISADKELCWFESKATQSRDAAARAEQTVRECEEGPPKEILYLRPDFHFSKHLQQILPHQILENIVGLNRFWMQTGVEIEQFRKDLETKDAKKEFLLLQKICERNTRKSK